MADRPIIVEHHPFVKTVARSLRQNCHIAPQSRLLLAISGGADSVALLRALHSLADRRKWQLGLTTAHIQHHLRTEAEQDAQFVQQLTADLGLPYLRADLDLSTDRVAWANSFAHEDQPAGATAFSDPDLSGESKPCSLVAGAESRQVGTPESTGTSGGNLESRARHARYHALEKLAIQSNATHILTAHHGDDQLETLLMRIIRGASIPGLAAIAWQRPLQPQSPIKLLRPLLAISRQQILTFLNDINQPWREDHTNLDVSRLRARLRHDVLPILHDLNPNTPRNAVRLADDFRNQRKVLQYATNAARKEIILESSSGGTADGTILSRPKARDIPRLILTQLLQQQLTESGVNPDKLGKQTLTPILKAIYDQKGGQRIFEIANNTTIEITREQIKINH